MYIREKSHWNLAAWFNAPIERGPGGFHGRLRIGDENHKVKLLWGLLKNEKTQTASMALSCSSSASITGKCDLSSERAAQLLEGAEVRYMGG